MPYSELIKNFSRIREYMREFYVYGFKSRDDYTQKSSRSYDDERRRLESWFGDYININYTPDGKNFSLSIDSRSTGGNPLFAAWKAKSFTDGAITLHFILFDILFSPEIKLTIKEITDSIEDYTAVFSSPRTFDESTVRKKLGEYEKLGMIRTEKQGKTVLYSRTEDIPQDAAMLAFFSEVTPCGVIGSYLLDKTEKTDIFAFKHHYITATTDSEIIYELFEAMHEKIYVRIETFGMKRSSGEPMTLRVIPLKVMMSVQNGRQHLMAYDTMHKRIIPLRTDNICSVTPDGECADFDRYRALLGSMMPHIWGVSTTSRSGDHIDHIEFTVRFSESEEYIYDRLMREKRCGTVTRLDENSAMFSADVYDSHELVPWIRTFICRITSFDCSDRQLKKQFIDDIHGMYALYGLTEGEEDAV